MYSQVTLEDPRSCSHWHCTVKRGCTAKRSFQAWPHCAAACGFGVAPAARKGRHIASRSGLRSDVQLVAGPSTIQTLRGQLCGREVALILCGEGHEDCIDLTRSRSVLEATFGWIPTADAFSYITPFHTKNDITLHVAKKWAARAMTREDDGGLLLFRLQNPAQGTGTAHVFRPDEILPQPGAQEENAVYFLWKDSDDEARLLREKKVRGEQLSIAKHDALLLGRKQRLRSKDRVELFDDWLIRAGNLLRPVEIVLEGPVPASEVTLHEEPGGYEVPIAHETSQALDLDSGEEEDFKDFKDFKGFRLIRFASDNATGSFLEYVRRRVRQHVASNRIHFFDLRELGDPDEFQMRKEFQRLVIQNPPVDLEEKRVQELGLGVARTAEDCPRPSWEAFFGAASELLYYSPHVHADYVPFLACVMKPPELLPKDWILKFFEHLYCGLVSDAIDMLRSDENAARFLRLRSMLHWNGERYQQRQDVRPLIPVSVAPLRCYLKAKDLPQARTWVSGLAERLRPKAQETSELVTKAQRWYLQEVEAFLQDVKGNDQDGDHFFAYLREVHREIYDDVDSNHASASPHVPSLSKPFGQKFYNLGEIKMPSFDEAMREILAFDPIDGKATTRRQRVLAKIIIDVFQLRMVDLASVLIVLDRALAYPKGSEVVIIMYAGSDHSHTVEKFYRDLGFSAKSLPRQGLVGKGWQDHYGPREPRGLRFPSYLYDFSELFRS